MTARIGIVGAGPVGIALALLLDHHGVATTLFEAEPAAQLGPRGSTLNARTMELFRRLGLSRELRQLGLPPDHPTDVRYLTRLDGFELARLAMPSERDKQRAVAASSELDQVPEPVLRANQMYVEQWLIRHVATRRHIEYRPGWRIGAFEQDATGVAVAASHAQLGTEQLAFDYLVGCDGARSTVRRQLGIALRGADGLGEQYFGGGMLATHVRAPALYDGCLRDRPAFQYWIGNPAARATVIALDGRGDFLVLTQNPDPDGPVAMPRLRETIERCFGPAAPVELVTARAWRAGVALVADRFCDRRVLLAGDAVHVFTPTGGFGMNTGIEDAANLAWKLAATVQGWGGPGLLASYGAERRPIALRNVAAARALSRRVGAVTIAPDIECDSPAGAAERDALGQVFAGFADQFDSMGVHLGARYDGSPIVIGDEPPPADRADRYEPSGVPGGRAPHCWLDAGRGIGSSLYDRLGAGFTLLRFGGDASAGAGLVDAARALSVPLAVVDVASRGARALYGRGLALVRPDHHIAWRGDGPLDDAAARSILAQVTAHPTRS